MLILLLVVGIPARRLLALTRRFGPVLVTGMDLVWTKAFPSTCLSPIRQNQTIRCCHSLPVLPIRMANSQQHALQVLRMPCPPVSHHLHPDRPISVDKTIDCIYGMLGFEQLHYTCKIVLESSKNPLKEPVAITISTRSIHQQSHIRDVLCPTRHSPVLAL